MNEFDEYIRVLYFNSFKLAVCQKNRYPADIILIFIENPQDLHLLFLILAKFASIDYIILICNLIQGLRKSDF